MRKTAGETIAAMRPIRAPREMNARVVTETGASTETAETLGMIDNTAPMMQRMCGTPETVPAGSQQSAERETGTGRGTVRERGTERGKEMILTEKMMHQCRMKEVTEEDMGEKRGGARAGRRAGTNHVQREWEEEGDVHQITLRKV